MHTQAFTQTYLELLAYWAGSLSKKNIST